VTSPYALILYYGQYPTATPFVAVISPIVVLVVAAVIVITVVLVVVLSLSLNICLCNGSFQVLGGLGIPALAAVTAFVAVGGLWLRGGVEAGGCRRVGGKQDE
jgi:hypothetical protein